MHSHARNVETRGGKEIIGLNPYRTYVCKQKNNEHFSKKKRNKKLKLNFKFKFRNYIIINT